LTILWESSLQTWAPTALIEAVFLVKARYQVRSGQVSGLIRCSAICVSKRDKMERDLVTAPCSSQFNFNSLLHPPSHAPHIRRSWFLSLNHHVVQFCPWFCGEGRKERHHTEIFPLTIDSPRWPDDQFHFNVINLQDAIYAPLAAWPSNFTRKLRLPSPMDASLFIPFPYGFLALDCLIKCRIEMSQVCLVTCLVPNSEPWPSKGSSECPPSSLLRGKWLF